MDTIWYYDKSGNAAFYRVGSNVYKDGQRIYWISDGNWYSDQSAKREFYESGTWLFDNSGTGRYYHS